MFPAVKNAYISIIPESATSVDHTCNIYTRTLKFVQPKSFETHKVMVGRGACMVSGFSVLVATECAFSTHYVSVWASGRAKAAPTI
jgi:hypothetical protein